MYIHLIYFKVISTIECGKKMQAQRSKTIKRVSTSRGGPKIAHLFFANNNFFFCDHSTI
jgi:hypothetical protein